MSQRQQVVIAASLLFVVSGILLFYRCGWRDVHSSHEARAAQNAQSMLHYRDARLPRLTDEQLDFQKPPLFYWVVAGIGWARGQIDAWSVRLPSALSAFACVVLVSGGLWRRQRSLAAVVAGLLLVTAHHFTSLGRTGRIDMPLTLCVTATIGGWVAGRWFCALGTLSAAAALLLKGPVGLVLPLAVVSSWYLAQVIIDQERPRFLPILASSAGAILIAAPWYVMAHHITDGEFTRVFFWYHNFQRATGGAEALAVHPWWYYGLRLLIDTLPSALLLPVALVYFFRRRLWNDREALFGLIWGASMMIVLSLSRFKRADYLVPAYPGWAIFLGCMVERCADSTSLMRRWILQGIWGWSFAAVVGWFVYLHFVEAPSEMRREAKSFATAIRQIVPAPEPILLFRVESHPLAFHLGRPVHTLLEWENLDEWAGRETPTYVVTTPELAVEGPKHLRHGRLEVVLRRENHEKPLFLLRICRNTENADGSSKR